MLYHFSFIFFVTKYDHSELCSNLRNKIANRNVTMSVTFYTHIPFVRREDVLHLI